MGIALVLLTLATFIAIASPLRHSQPAMATLLILALGWSTVQTYRYIREER